jgi:hypothetical protein
MKTYCDNPLCESQSVKEVSVSVETPADQVRALCAACEEVYGWGIQHGKLVMLNKINEGIEQVLDCLDVGGEQSRQFAEEIRILRELIE